MFKWVLLVALGAVYCAHAEFAIENEVHFAHDFYQELIKHEDLKNMVVSPFFVYQYLSMFGYGASGETMEQIQNALGYPIRNKHQLYDFIDFYFSLVENSKDWIFMKEEVQKIDWKPSFRRVMESFVIKPIIKPDGTIMKQWNWHDFEKNADVAKALESIKSMIMFKNPEGVIRPHMATQVIPKFLYGFDKSKTQNHEFMISPKIHKPVPTMFSKAPYMYGMLPEFNAKFIIMPLMQSHMRMVIVMPEQMMGLKYLEQNSHLLNEHYFMKYGKMGLVSLMLPKFQIKSAFSLDWILDKMGMENMFDEDKADFSHMSEDSRTYIGDFLQVNMMMVSDMEMNLDMNEMNMQKLGMHMPKLDLSMNRLDMPNMMLEENLLEPHRMMPQQWNESLKEISLHIDRPFYFMIMYHDALIYQGHVIDPTMY